MLTKPPPYPLPSRLGVKTGRMDVVAFESGLTPDTLAGDGTMLYPGISRELELPIVAEIVKDAAVGKPSPMLEEIAVPMIEDPELLDTFNKPVEGRLRE